MNRKELIASVQADTGLTKKAAEQAVDSTFATIEKALKGGDKVQLIGFGTFETKERSARVGRNPQTGAEMQLPETTVPHFKPGKGLKDAVAGK